MNPALPQTIRSAAAKLGSSKKTDTTSKYGYTMWRGQFTCIGVGIIRSVYAEVPKVCFSFIIVLHARGNFTVPKANKQVKCVYFTCLVPMYVCIKSYNGGQVSATQYIKHYFTKCS